MALAAAILIGVAIATAAVLRSTAPPPSSPAVSAGPTARPPAVQAGSGQIDYLALDARIRRMMQDPSLQGLAIAVVEDGRLTFVEGYGVASSDGERVTPETVFRWASLSKTVAGVATAKLADAGALSLSDPVATFGTSLRLPGDAQTALTLEHLLSQRTGLPKNAYDGWLEGGRDPKAIRQMLAGATLECPPGTCHSYQNVAYDAISEVLAAASGQTYPALVQQQLFAPLGMGSASFGLDGLRQAERWARPFRRGAALPLDETYYRTPAAAGVNSNIVDLARWMQALMGAAPEVLSAEVLNAAQQPRVNTGRVYGNSPFGRALERPAYGLGIRSFTYRGHRLLGHSGAVAGYRSTMMFDPAARTGVVMLWNSDAGLPFRLQGEVFDHAYHLPATDWLALPPVPSGTP